MVIRVLVADDQALVREALATLLEMEDDLQVVAQAATGEEAAARASEVDVCLLDVQMPGCGGIEATRRIHAAHPSVRCLMVTTFRRPGYLTQALEAGASGFITKDTPARELAEAIRRVHAGLRVVDPQLAVDALALGHNPLTSREADVLRVAESGATITAMASVLRLSPGTVRNHVSSAMAKTLGATRADAARIARANGWL